MKQDKQIIIKETLNEISEEKAGLQEKVNKNLNRIQEIDAYLKSIYDKEDTDFKVFSPRNVENVYKEQIDKGNKEKYTLENENRNLYSQINRLNHYTENIQSLLEDKESDFNLKNLDIQEKDRQRIARDLHDTSLQNLAHLIHRIELSSMYIDKDPIQAKLELASINKNMKSIIEDIRNTIFDLRPMSFDDLGFTDMLNDFLRKLQDRYKIQVNSEIDNIQSSNQILLISLYRVIKECCLNAMEHSECQLLIVKVKNNQHLNSIDIEVKDDGVGFDIYDVSSSMSNHYGLKIMRERINLLGGTISINSQNGKGTCINIYVPIHDK